MKKEKILNTEKVFKNTKVKDLKEIILDNYYNFKGFTEKNNNYSLGGVKQISITCY